MVESGRGSGGGGWSLVGVFLLLCGALHQAGPEAAATPGWNTEQGPWRYSPGVRVTLPKALGKRVAGDFQLGDSVVLIRCHGCELGLCEDEGLEVLLGVALTVLAWVHENHMEARLVAVHGVENDLWGVQKRGAQGWGTAASCH